jgi:hypothetical protein
VPTLIPQPQERHVFSIVHIFAGNEHGRFQVALTKRIKDGLIALKP